MSVLLGPTWDGAAFQVLAGQGVDAHVPADPKSNGLELGSFLASGGCGRNYGPTHFCKASAPDVWRRSLEAVVGCQVSKLKAWVPLYYLHSKMIVPFSEIVIFRESLFTLDVIQITLSQNKITLQKNDTLQK